MRRRIKLRRASNRRNDVILYYVGLEMCHVEVDGEVT